MAYGGCKVRKRAVEIQQVKTVNNISYAEAVKTVQGRRERKKQTKSLKVQDQEEVKEGML